MASPILQIKRGNAGVGGTVPGLRAGEPAISLNNYDLFVGIDTTVANNKFFGSHRYWGREDGTTALRLKLVDKGGTNSINLKSPDTLAGVTTYTFPETPVNGNYLRVDASGNLSWADVATGASFTNATLSGITTISGSLNVTATSNFTGISTFSTVDINGGNIDGTVIGSASAAAGTFTQLNYSNSSTSGISTVGSLFIGTTKVVSTEGGLVTLSGIATIDATTKSTLESILALEPNSFTTLNVSGISTFGGLVNANAGITVTGQTTLNNNLSVTGISTFTGAIVANGNVTLGDASGDTILIKGTTTFEQPVVGTISTATRATRIDTTTATAGTYYPGLFVSNTGVASTSVFVDAGISYVSDTDTLTLTGDLAVNGGDVTTSASTFNLINANATSVNFAGAATALTMGAATGIATISNATLTLPNATTVNVNGANPTLASSSTGTLTLFNTNLTAVNAFGAGTAVQLSAATGITTIRNNLTVAGDLRINGNDIQASDGNNNITLTSNTLTTFAGDIRVNGNDVQASDGNTNITMTSNTLTTFAGDIKVTGNDIQSSSATALTLSGADVTVAGDLTVGGNDIKASNGTTALTLATTGAVTAANDLTVTGNLYVNGSTTQVNTAALTVEDRTIDLGIVNGAAPASATTWDLGVLFNYFSGSAKKSGVIWEHGDARFKFASVLAADTDGTTVDTPQLTVTTFAPIEVASLWVNNTCTGGTQEVIGCIGSELNLQNIVVDAGTF
jgi:hypothetical protein